MHLFIPMCTCQVKSTCEAIRIVKSNHKLLHIFHILIGLNEDFSFTKSQILLTDPLPLIRAGQRVRPDGFGYKILTQSNPRFIYEGSFPSNINTVWMGSVCADCGLV